ncbi:SDR family oxidoreductase [Sediminibacterium roseum]|uniref:SDR family oxidoreductase n=1 Tax=Sediminibacterium roseum TaxID=1978412 RepID=A0ABW9ZTQ3_9BACT|nr:SDR family oxidoreductase [Sediminibacterium roseum]NCI50506.1 SDR family oxidoreductase [Sediminibacterium roseum]
MAKAKKQTKPRQSQQRPGSETRMHPKPVSEPVYPGSGRLRDKKLLITGGDSGIGKAVAILFAKEGADVAIVYLNENADARQAKKEVEQYGRQCLLIKGDLAKEAFCKKAVKETVKQFGRIDILVNNAALHYETKKIEDITTAKLQKVFAVNVFAMIHIIQHALPFMKRGSCIINTSSVTAYRGSKHLLDYAATKGAIVSFTRSLSANLVKKGIRVNGVAPGPIWTPLIPASFKANRVSHHGAETPMERAGEPAEVAPAFLFLATEDSSYITGQFIHPNGGEIING